MKSQLYIDPTLLQPADYPVLVRLLLNKAVDLHLSAEDEALAGLLGQLGLGYAIADYVEGDNHYQLIEAGMAALYAAVPRSIRTGKVQRTTSETDIHIALNLDGSGKAAIQTGLGFFDHMLDQLARHGGIDLTIQVKGDLHIDEHHTIEDTALALGECFKQALGDKRGIYRYGFLLPMDESLAQVGIDFGGRPWLVWQADFKREKVGDMPTEMFHHFFKSFSDAAACNLNIQVAGDNEHHKIEAIFKGWAKAIKMAIQHDPHSDSIPSTKGVI